MPGPGTSGLQASRLAKHACDPSFRCPDASLVEQESGVGSLAVTYLDRMEDSPLGDRDGVANVIALDASGHGVIVMNLERDSRAGQIYPADPFHRINISEADSSAVQATHDGLPGVCQSPAHRPARCRDLT